MNIIDAIQLARDLIRCPSVTPADAGALDVLQASLESLDFVCHRLTFSEEGTADIDNLYARYGTGAPNFCFAGHTDVVPAGDPNSWKLDPFAGAVDEGSLHGRGASDMKGAIAAFVEAVSRFQQDRGPSFDGSITLLITGDEEGVAVNGTRKVLEWMAEKGEVIDVCLVGEPTNPEVLGDMIKIGRRGSLTGTLTVTGVQGHTAYPHLAENPLPRLVRMLDDIANTPLDEGSEHFQPSDLQLTTIDVGNPAGNVIPERAVARFNIRFNSFHTGESLTRWLHEKCMAVGGHYELEVRVTGEAFITSPGKFSALLARAVKQVTDIEPELSTSGGTSDARFIKDYCPVAEFGLVGRTMHKIDEQVSVADVRDLVQIYRQVLGTYFDETASGTGA